MQNKWLYIIDLISIDITFNRINQIHAAFRANYKCSKSHVSVHIIRELHGEAWAIGL